MKIFVLVRVHDRLRDLEVCVATIARYWKRHDYQMLVVANGPEDAGVLEALKKADAGYVRLTENLGHLRGNSSLLLEGARRLPPDCSHVVILEADTWLFDDRLVDLYARRMLANGSVWASAEWLERYESVALDFAVIDASFLRAHPDVLDFDVHPESRVADYLAERGQKRQVIRELMPVHIPSVLRRFYNRYGGRFCSFVEGPMVTHHAEDLPGGFEEKLRIANHVLGRREFDVPDSRDPRSERARLARIQRIARLAPRSAWIRKTKTRDQTIASSRN